MNEIALKIRSMPDRSSTDRIKLYFQAELNGHVDRNTVIEICTKIESHLYQWHDIPMIWDVSSSDLSDLDFNEIQKLSVDLKAHWPFINVYTCGIVSENEFNLVISRLFKEVHDKSGNSLKVFSSMKDALAWIQVPAIPSDTKLLGKKNAYN